MCGIVSIAFSSPTTEQFAPGALGMTVPLVTSYKELDNHLGRLVAIRGPISRTKIPTIIGVDIGNQKDLTGVEAYAVGILTRHDITAEDIANANGRNGPIANRGPGTSYTLYFDLAGRLADAKAWPASE